MSDQLEQPSGFNRHLEIRRRLKIKIPGYAWEVIPERGMFSVYAIRDLDRRHVGTIDPLKFDEEHDFESIRIAVNSERW